MPFGKIKKKCDKGFGFIQPDSSDKNDLFFHATALLGVTFDDLQEGASVEYSIGQGPKGPRAENIKVN